MDFNGYVKKLSSYTSTVRALEDHLAWWHSLSDSAKTGTSAVDRLVEIGEQSILATQFSRNLVIRENVEDVELEGATSGSRSLTLREKKKVEVVGVDGAASGKAITIEGATSDNVTTIEGAASDKSATAPPTAGQ